MEFTEVEVAGQKKYDLGKGQIVTFPLVLRPQFTEENSFDPSARLQTVLQHITSHRDSLTRRLLSCGGVVIFKNCGVSSPSSFLSFMEAFGRPFGSYAGGGGPRRVVLGPIQTSTESPPDLFIQFHHELAYLSKPPGGLFFYCERPVAKDTLGGETPVLPSPWLYRRVADERPQFLARLLEKKVRYHRILADKSSCSDEYQRSWQDAFETSDRTQAEAVARATGAEVFDWLPNGDVRVVSAPMDAIRREPRTGHLTWLNAIVLLHPSAYREDDTDVVRGGESAVRLSDDAPWTVTYGDGAPIDGDDVRAVAKIMKEGGAYLKWEEGDVMLVDNTLALHARNSFTPPRRILAAIFD